MKIALAQTRPVKGDIDGNIQSHIRFIEQAVSNRADLIIFPELSVTGYEPTLAKELATTKDDLRFNCFQAVADSDHITIGIGAPIRGDTGICIGMVLFLPRQPREIYLKEFIHADEEPFFVNGHNSPGLIGDKHDIALAICYELSIPAHSERAFQRGAKIYLTSVAKTASGVAAASKSLSEIAAKFSMTTLMCNCVGPCDNFQAAGGSAVWNHKGALLAQLDDTNEGLLLFDTATVGPAILSPV